MTHSRLLAVTSFFLMILVAASGAFANPLPAGWEIGFQEPASPVMERIIGFHNMLLWIITITTIFVMALLFWIAVRYNAKANPVPSKTTHNTLLEIIWTVIPVIILVVVAVPSMQLLYYGDRTATPDMTLKITGYQWYWGYEYPDHGDIALTANMIPQDKIDVAAGQKRLLSTDTPVVLPVDTNIQLLVTAADVLHSFAVPAFGVKVDAVPGRLNEGWVRITKPGTYFGQCSELCGLNHAFMPIEIKAVAKEEFAAWTASQGFVAPAAETNTEDNAQEGNE